MSLFVIDQRSSLGRVHNDRARDGRRVTKVVSECARERVNRNSNIWRTCPSEVPSSSTISGLFLLRLLPIGRVGVTGIVAGRTQSDQTPIPTTDSAVAAGVILDK
jgi:hypothetical protein